MTQREQQTVTLGRRNRGGAPGAVGLELRWTDIGGEHSVALAGRMTLGSGEGVDVTVREPSVSRLHAEFDERAGETWIRDLGSRNGTAVEGVTIGEAKLGPGLRIRVGEQTLTVEASSADDSVEEWTAPNFERLVGRSSAMRVLFARLSRVAALDSTVLIEGETGSGKELVAEAIHSASPRAAAPFVVIDCGSLPETLLEAELFGHAKGAFTGAANAREGAIESAEGGTVFLDEIGELPLPMQPKLLRVLESRTIRRLGETTRRKVDVRFVSATHRNLRAMVNAGAFREDLYFRLAVVPVSIPPLRSRPEDIPLLVEHFLPPGAKNQGTANLIRELSNRPWLGNVRELRNFVERALSLGPREALELASSQEGSAAPKIGFGAVNVPLDRPFKELREQWIDFLEREYLAGLLKLHHGNVTAVAQASGLDRTHVHRILRKHRGV